MLSLTPRHLPPYGAGPLAKKPNYSFEKRKKEQDRKAKKDEKLARKRENAELRKTSDEDPDLAGIKLGPQDAEPEEGEQDEESDTPDE
ncbi:MAG: hypothetical protein JWO05_2886 [Gemmatimonadetes bacterium]|nr:hypothetical protein [Gemmatimonadota bacterium]